MHLVVVALSLGSALAAAVSTTLKKATATRAAGRAGAGLGSPMWVGGVCADVVAAGLQILALHAGALAVVQPLLVSGLLFALLLRHFGSWDFDSGELLWGGVLAACLGGFLVLSGATRGVSSANPVDPVSALVIAVATVGAVAVCVALARRTVPPTVRAALFGVAVGAVYAVLAAVLKAATDVLTHHGWQALVTGWQLYAVVLLGGSGQVLAQLGFRAGPLTSSLPATYTVDPLLSVLLGVLLYREQVRRGPAGGAVLAVLVTLLVVAVLRLARHDQANATREADGTAYPAPRADEPVREGAARSADSWLGKRHNG